MTQVDVKDFGPIAEASVELKPLTVFMGPNNSGKSHLALALYCLSRTLSSFPSSEVLSLGRWRRRSMFSEELLQQTADELKQVWPTVSSFPHGSIKVSDLTDGLQDALTKASRILADGLSSDFGSELERCYGIKLGNLVRGTTTRDGTQLEVRLSQPASGFVWTMQASRGMMSTNAWDRGVHDRLFDLERDGTGMREALLDPDHFLTLALNFNMRSALEIMTPAHYMPANRSAILQWHSTLAGLIIGQASRAWLDPIEIRKLPGVVTDAIQAILMWERNNSPGDVLEKVIGFLEESVLQGTVSMDTATEYSEIFYENNIRKFSLHQVSSMVSEIAPIVLYLRHMVRRGHLFIIEEPESHIDAANQMKLARAIAMLVNAGVYVLITTHSDFFVKQLDNLLLVSQLTPRRRAARKYSATEVLQPSDVGAYMFEPGPDGSTVRTLEVTADGGIPAEPFSDAHTDLYDEAIALEHTAR